MVYEMHGDGDVFFNYNKIIYTFDLFFLSFFKLKQTHPIYHLTS